MSSIEADNASDLGPDPTYREIYVLGAAVAVLLVVVMAVSVVAYVNWPYAAGTNSTEQLFDLAQESIPGALTALDAGLSLANLAAIVLYLALYQALKQVNRSYALIALAFGLVAISSLIAARPVLEIFGFSELHRAAPSVSEQSRYLAAGDALLMLFHGSAFKSYLLLGNTSFVISAALMLGSAHFGRLVGWIGLVSNIVALGFLSPTIGPLFAFLAMPGQAVWLLLVARTFYRFGHQSGYQSGSSLDGRRDAPSSCQDYHDTQGVANASSTQK